MSQPERPTCKTCPYWGEDTSNVLNHRAQHGECRRYPPGFIPLETAYMPAHTAADFWCGEHPEFPVYLSVLKHREASERALGILYVLGSCVTILILLSASYILEHIGNRRHGNPACN